MREAFPIQLASSHGDVWRDGTWCLEPCRGRSM